MAVVVLLAATSWTIGAESPAQRVVVLAPHLAELVCAAGACDALVGRVRYSDYPVALQALPLVGDAYAVNVEAVLALQPDLVLAWDGGTPPELLRQLQGFSLRVEILRTDTLEDIPEALEQVGQWMGSAHAARQAAQQFRVDLQSLRQRYQASSPLRVLYQIEAGPLFSINASSPISAAIAVCGGTNVFANMPQRSAPISLEAAVLANPEAIVFGRQDRVDDIRRAWADAPAVAASRHGALYAVDADLLSRPTPRMVQGMETLCAALDDARRRRRGAD